MEGLKRIVTDKSTEYWNETAEDGQKITAMLTSIVDFVVEYFFNSSHFPAGYTEEKKLKEMMRFQNAMAMACVEVYAKAGAEGQVSHAENSISRSYDSAWISKKLIAGLPNYADFF